MTHKHIFTSQGNLKLGRNREHRRLEATMDSQARSNSVQGSGRRNYAKEGVSQTTSPSTLDTQSREMQGSNTADGELGIGDLLPVLDTQYRESERANSKSATPQSSRAINGDGNFPDITFCPHLDYCPVVSSKKCLFNFGYESCQVNKFYNRWGR